MPERQTFVRRTNPTPHTGFKGSAVSSLQHELGKKQNRRSRLTWSVAGLGQPGVAVRTSFCARGHHKSPGPISGGSVVCASRGRRGGRLLSTSRDWTMSAGPTATAAATRRSGTSTVHSRRHEPQEGHAWD